MIDITEYKQCLAQIDNETRAKKEELARKFAVANNTVSIGDTVEDHIGKITVERINVQVIGERPQCVYLGVEITKQGKPRKDGRKRGVYQRNLKKG